jgi:hypothetical protein
MVKLFSERRMVENEAVFRRLNEQTNQSIIEIQKVAEEEGQESFTPPDDLRLHFYCECADENCTQRIVINLNEYIKIHKKRDCFIVIPGHEVVAIERITHKEPEYLVVQKLLDPPENTTTLHPTDIDNS